MCIAHVCNCVCAYKSHSCMVSYSLSEGGGGASTIVSRVRAHVLLGKYLCTIFHKGSMLQYKLLYKGMEVISMRAKIMIIDLYLSAHGCLPGPDAMVYMYVSPKHSLISCCMNGTYVELWWCHFSVRPQTQNLKWKAQH